MNSKEIIAAIKKEIVEALINMELPVFGDLDPDIVTSYFLNVVGKYRDTWMMELKHHVMSESWGLVTVEDQTNIPDHEILEDTAIYLMLVHKDGRQIKFTIEGNKLAFNFSSPL